MAEIPFTVSARTAILLGRQNIASVEGAFIELIKNAYDADAQNCYIYFDIKFSEVPEKISSKNFHNQLEEFYNYSEKNSNYVLDPSYSPDNERLVSALQSLNRIIICDDGHGMTEKVIRNSWMTIGTLHKRLSELSREGRVVTGAKGIGRFALDRIGANCQMHTVSSEDPPLYWSVDWKQFDKTEGPISNVKAKLKRRKKKEFSELLEELPVSFKHLKNFDTGTIFEIRSLRAWWTPKKIKSLIDDIEVLTPPSETNFEIFIQGFGIDAPEGKVLNPTFDEYDYRLDGTVTEGGDVKLTIYRNEFNINKIPEKFFKNHDYPYDKDTFLEGKFTKEISISNLIPGKSSREYSAVGPFSISLYFVKKGLRNDSEKFYHKDIDVSLRKNWLEKYSGLKIYRDGFRVRPYGENDREGYDWLNLGDRATKNPHGISRGNMLFKPYQLAGIIHISRLDNSGLQDKSSRDGLIENDVFKKFKTLVLGFVHQLEKARSQAHEELSNFYTSQHPEEEKADEGEKLAEDILNKEKRKKKKRIQTRSELEEDSQETKLAYAVKRLKEETSEQADEIRLLRILASSGLTVSSFAHDLRNINSTLVSRVEELQDMIEEVLPDGTLDDIPDEDNPLVLLDYLKRDDEKIKSWLKFSLEIIKKDRRRRKKIYLSDYFSKLERDWDSLMESKHVEFQYTLSSDSLALRAFPMDLDSMFVNLIANSLDAFKRGTPAEDRKIRINTTREGNQIQFCYTDFGPGLDKGIENPYDIIRPGFTTKRDNYGNEVGTGLGMWIVKSVVDDYKGSLDIENPEKGFSTTIRIPLRKNQ